MEFFVLLMDRACMTNRIFNLTVHNCQNEKVYSWHAPAIKAEAVGLKACNFTLKIMIFVKMWNF